jgi:galactose-1-phosphate uridylyltransferase
LQRGENKMKYLASVEQITGLFLVDVMPSDAAKKIRDFHTQNEK